MDRIVNFLKSINDDQEFKKEIEKKEKLYMEETKQTKMNYKSFLEDEIIPVAKKYGFSFTADDYIKFMKNNSTRSLSENELEDVAGGRRIVLPIMMAALSFFGNSVPSYAMHSGSNGTSGSSVEKVVNNFCLSKREKEQIRDALGIKEEIDNDANHKYHGGKTLLHCAAEKDANEIAELLISKGVNINEKDENGLTPLHIAVRNSNPEMIEMLISKGADINAKDQYGNTPLHIAAEKGSLRSTDILISNRADINAKSDNGSTPLHYAAMKDHFFLVHLFLTKANAKIDEKDNVGKTPLHVAAANVANDAAETLINSGADINARDYLGITPLHTAAEHNADKVAELLISQKADINAKDMWRETPLHDAAEHNADKVAKLLISKGADINAKDRNDMTPLDIAKNKAATNVVDLLKIAHFANDCGISKEFDINDIDHQYGKTNKTLFHYAAEKDENGIAELLISKGADINAKDKGGWTPLYYAAKKNASKVAELLISKGADINAKSANEVTPLHVAARNNADKVAELLISKRADINAKDELEGKTPLHDAARRNADKVAELLISKGADINAKSDNGSTPLHYAAEHNADKVAKLLISKGADINARDDHQRKPLDVAKKDNDTYRLLKNKEILDDICKWLGLNKEEKGRFDELNSENINELLHIAAKKDSKEAAETLISKGANIDAKGEAGRTPLHVATANNANKVTELLISKGAKINVKDNYGYTPLHIATEKNDLKSVELLISKGIDINTQDNKYRTPLELAKKDSDVYKLLERKTVDDICTQLKLNAEEKSYFNELNRKNIDKLWHIASKRDAVNLVGLLISKGVNINANEIDETEKNSPLHIAAENNAEKIAELLISRGSDINANNNKRKTPLHIAADHNADKVAALLISKGANINAKDESQMTPLHISAKNNAGKIAELLISSGADINAKDRWEETPLRVAAINNADKVAEILISKGADINEKNSSGETLLHYAAVKNSKEVAKILIEKGVDINAKDNLGHTPLYLAVRYDSVETVDLLIQNKVKVDEKNEFTGQTELHYAAKNDALQIVDLLIKANANVNAVDNEGKTPLDVAKNNSAVYNLLKHNGGIEQKIQPNIKTVNSAIGAKKVGLTNIGNSCYFNAAIQLINSSSYLREKAIELYDNGKIKPNSQLKGFTEVLKEINKSNDRTVLNSNFMKQKIDKFIDHKTGGDSSNVITNILVSIGEEKGSHTSEHIGSFCKFKETEDIMLKKLKEEKPKYFFLNYSGKEDTIPLSYNLGNGVVYEAKSVMVGTGHAICYVKQADGKWTLFDDASIKENISEVNQQYDQKLICYEKT